MDKLTEYENRDELFVSSASNGLENLLSKTSPSSLCANSGFQSGKITDVLEGGIFKVDVEKIIIEARLSDSCFIIPNCYDTVLVFINSNGENYIVNVLQTFDKKSVRFEVDHFQVLSNKYMIETQNMSFKSTDFNSQSSNYSIEAIEYSLVSQKSTKEVNLNVERYSNSRKFVYNNDIVRAMNINYSADMLTRIQGNSTILLGKELLKNDAELIITG